MTVFDLPAPLVLRILPDGRRTVAAARLNGPDEPDVCPRWSAHFGCYYEATCEIFDGERELRREIGLVFTVREE